MATDCYFTKVTNIRPHPNADRLELANAGNWPVVIAKGSFEEGADALFICPDAALPNHMEWAKPYLQYTGSGCRVKTVKLRGEFSNGILVKMEEITSLILEANIPAERIFCLRGPTIAEILCISHWESPRVGSLDVKSSSLPLGLSKTDEENWESLREDELRLGQEALVTKKLDGCSATYIACPNGEFHMCGRRMTYKEDSSNRYTIIGKQVIPAIMKYAKKHNKVIAVRGEITGRGIQDFKINKDCKGPIKFSLFNCTFPEESDVNLRNGHWGTPNHFLEVNKELGLNTVPILGTVTVTKELLKEYQSASYEIGEGVVLNFKDGHYKAKSADYYSRAHTK